MNDNHIEKHVCLMLAHESNSVYTPRNWNYDPKLLSPYYAFHKILPKSTINQLCGFTAHKGRIYGFLLKIPFLIDFLKK